MGNKWRSGGGKSPSTLSVPLLRRRIEACKYKYKYLAADEIAAHLRSTHREYERIKLQPFTITVKRTLDEIRSAQTPKPNAPNRATSSPSFSMDDSDVADSPVRKRGRRDPGEERLQRLEEKHLNRRIQPALSSGSETDSSEESSSDETDDDAVYEQKVEPAFDITKSMLRAGYSKKVQKPEKNVELEVVSNSKTPKKNDLFGGNDKGLSGEVKGEDGPRFKDLGGMSEVVEGLKSEVMFPLFNPQMMRKIGVKPIKGILLKGPPGCGKTKLAHAIANEAGVPFYKIPATELVSGVSGASEENIRELFAKAHRTVPSIIFIDEIDAIGSKRENQQREMERRIVTQLMTCMDESHKAVRAADGDSNASDKSDSVLVIGATNRPDALDSALRRPGRFDREITLSVPDEKARLEILSVLTANLRVEGEGSFDLAKIARSTPGFVGADLAALVDKAGNLAMKRIIDRRKSELSKESLQGNHAEDWWKRLLTTEEMENLSITMADVEEAAALVQPSSRREGFSSIPNVKWEDVGGLPELRKDFDRYIVRPIKYPEIYRKVDLDFGFLLYGPPGCGKTLIAKAVANESGANFIHIKGPELLNKYVGESELAIRTLFSRARTCSPCILFFDEVDALTANGETEGGGVVGRLLRQLMIELSGSDERRNVFLIGATNRPEVMDRALFRNERFGKLMHVRLPTADERGSILTALARKKPIDPSVDLIAIGRDEACQNLSGADLSALMNEAAMVAVEEIVAAGSINSGISWTIKKEHFEQALKKISPSVSEEQKQHYYHFEESLKAA